MEQWEIDLRAKLDIQLRSGTYTFGGQKEGDMVFATGKGGAINYFVLEERLKRESMGLEPLIKEFDGSQYKSLGGATEDDFIDLIKTLMCKINGK